VHDSATHILIGAGLLVGGPRRGPVPAALLSRCTVPVVVGGPGLEPGWVSPHAPQTCFLTSDLQMNLFTHTAREFRVIEPISCRAIQRPGSVRGPRPQILARPGCRRPGLRDAVAACRHLATHRSEASAMAVRSARGRSGIKSSRPSWASPASPAPPRGGGRVAGLADPGRRRADEAPWRA